VSVVSANEKKELFEFSTTWRNSRWEWIFEFDS